MGKQIVIYPYNGMLLSNKKKNTTVIVNNMDDSYRYRAEWNKSDKKRVYTIHKIWENVNASMVTDSR